VVPNAPAVGLPASPPALSSRLIVLLFCPGVPLTHLFSLFFNLTPSSYSCPSTLRPVFENIYVERHSTAPLSLISFRAPCNCSGRCLPLFQLLSTSCPQFCCRSLFSTALLPLPLPPGAVDVRGFPPPPINPMSPPDGLAVPSDPSAYRSPFRA